MKKGLELIMAYFGNPRKVILMGIGCALYFFYTRFAEEPLIANVFPPFKGVYYWVLGVLIVIYQIVIWRKFKILNLEGWKHPITPFLFASEFVTFLFALSLLSWPFYLIYQFLVYADRL